MDYGPPKGIAVAPVPHLGWWRNVCHNCGFRYPATTLHRMPVKGESGACCRAPNIHQHTGALCVLCRGPDGPPPDHLCEGCEGAADRRLDSDWYCAPCFEVATRDAPPEVRNQYGTLPPGPERIDPDLTWPDL